MRSARSLGSVGVIKLDDMGAGGAAGKGRAAVNGADGSSGALYFSAMEHKRQRVVLTVDALIADADGRILLIERGTEPFKGSWVLPGGLVDPGETVQESCIREVEEELGLNVRIIRLIGIYSTPGRDPRGSFVSIAFHAEMVAGEIVPTEEAPSHRWLGAAEDLALGFDHARIVADHRAFVMGAGRS